jgi:hypothetical protein
MSDPNQALQALLQPAPLRSNLFPPTSRYAGMETTTMEIAPGRLLIYLRRRFLPSPDNFALLQEHVVSEKERIDHVAARYLGDSEQFWRICDANGAMRPEELTEAVGRRLRITLPEGIPGIPDA